MNRQFFVLCLALIVCLNGLPTPQIVNAAIFEREPNDERSQKLGEMRLNQTIEVAGAFRTGSDTADHYSVEILDNGSLIIRLQSVSHLLAKIYRDNDGSGTVSPADRFIGTIQSGQAIKAHQPGKYVVQVFKPPHTNGLPSYTLLFVNQK